jgi:hypothetical protein
VLHGVCGVFGMWCGLGLIMVCEVRYGVMCGVCGGLVCVV